MRRATLDQDEEEGEAHGMMQLPSTDRRLRRAALAGASDGGASDAADEEEADGMARLLAEQRVFLSSQRAPAARLVRREGAAEAASSSGAFGGLVGLGWDG